MIELNAIPEVALDCLNEDHREAANIINQLDACLQQEPFPSAELTPLFNRLVEHIENHFACEEHQMEKYQFPALVTHRQEHQRILAEIKQKQKHGFNEKLDALNYLQNVFTPWLIEHVATLDTETARYIVNAGGR